MENKTCTVCNTEKKSTVFTKIIQNVKILISKEG